MSKQLKELPVHQFNSVLSRIMANNYLAENKTDAKEKHYRAIEQDILLLSSRFSNLFDYLQLISLSEKKVPIKSFNIQKIFNVLSKTYKFEIKEISPLITQNNKSCLEKLFEILITFIHAKNAKVESLRQIGSRNFRIITTQVVNTEYNDKDLEEEQLIREAKIKILQDLTSTKIKFRKNVIDIYVSDII